MVFANAGQLVRAAPTATPDDALGLVAENLRHSHYGALAVLDRILPGDGEGNWATTGAHLVGLIEEKDLSRFTLPVLARETAPRAVAVLPGEQNGHLHAELEIADLNGGSHNGHAPAMAPPEAFSIPQMKARDVMRRDFGVVPAAFSLQNALLTLDRYDATALPVVDVEGRFRGMIARSDVVAALGEYVRPPVVGGMATPLGVWLTDGRLQGGAPPLGLFLSGLVLAACLMVAHISLGVVLSNISPQIGAMFFSGRYGAFAAGGGAFNLLVTMVEGFLFLTLMRLTPMAGIHAAEHQTVWALERGVALTPETVAQMPRAHPRGGTNLLVLGSLIQIMLQHAPAYDGLYVLLSLLCAFFFWRQFGTFLQNHFTTRPATRKQLESGIKAGREIMEKFQSQPHLMPSMAQRLFNSGMIFAAGGMMLGMYIFQYSLEKFLPMFLPK